MGAVLWVYRWKIMLGAAQREAAGGDLEAAKQHLQESLQEAVRRYGDKHKHLLEIWSLAIELAARQQLDEEALQAARQALSVAEVAYGDESEETATWHLRVAGWALRLQAFREAEAHADQSVAIYLSMQPRRMMELAEAKMMLGRIALRLKQHPRALALFGDALKVMDQHATPSSMHQVRTLRLEAADLLALQEDEDEALKLIEPLLLMPDDGDGMGIFRDHAEAFSLQSTILAHQKKTQDAEVALEKALILWRKSLPSSPSIGAFEGGARLPEGYIRDLSRWGSKLQSDARWDEAIASYEEAHKAMLLDEQPHAELLAVLMGALGDCYRETQRYEDAEKAYAEALEWEQAMKGDVHPDVSVLRNNLASVYYAQGRLDEALPLYRLALRSLEASHPQHPSIPALLHNVGRILGEQETFEEADASFLRALAVAEQVLGREHEEIAKILGSHEGLLRKMGEVDRAERLATRLRKLRQQNKPA